MFSLNFPFSPYCLFFFILCLILSTFLIYAYVTNVLFLIFHKNWDFQLKEKERRKSLGTLSDWSVEDQQMFANPDEFWCSSGSNSPSGGMGVAQNVAKSTATGHRELDLCLRHHLVRCCNAVKVCEIYLCSQHTGSILVVIQEGESKNFSPSALILKNFHFEIRAVDGAICF